MAVDQAEGRSLVNSAGAVAARGSARTTRSVPVGVLGICSAAKCRSLRLTRFRVTALPTPLDTTSPTRSRSLGSRLACKTRVGLPTRTPERMVREKSAERVILTVLGSTGCRGGSGGQLLAAFAPAGGQDGPARSSPHPMAEAMGTAAAPVARLERALAHGKAPTNRTGDGLAETLPATF
jgi:hypothetical protein